MSAMVIFGGRGKCAMADVWRTNIPSRSESWNQLLSRRFHLRHHEPPWSVQYLYGEKHTQTDHRNRKMFKILSIGCVVVYLRLFHCSLHWGFRNVLAMNCRFMGIYIHTPGGQNRHIGILSFGSQGLDYTYNTIRYDTRCYFNVRSKADISQLNLPHKLNLPHIIYNDAYIHT